jgi:hypothetical protein
MSEPTVKLITLEGDRIEATSKLLDIIGLLSETPEPLEEIDLGVLGIDSSTLRLILVYCEHHGYVEVSYTKQIIILNALEQYVKDQWDVEFVRALDCEQFLRLFKASQSLLVKPLVELCSLALATLFARKSPDQLAEMAGKDVQMTPQLEQYLKALHGWASYN